MISKFNLLDFLARLFNEGYDEADEEAKGEDAVRDGGHPPADRPLDGVEDVVPHDRDDQGHERGHEDEGEDQPGLGGAGGAIQAELEVRVAVTGAVDAGDPVGLGLLVDQEG